MSARVTMHCLCVAAPGGALGCTSLRGWTGNAAALVLPSALSESRVVGRVSAGGQGAALGRAAVYLEPIDARSVSKAPAAATVREHVGTFEPDFLVVAIGQPRSRGARSPLVRSAR